MPEFGNVILFGATGNTGLTFLERGIKDGLNITAYVRTPSKIPAKLQKDITIVEGDARDKKAVADAIKGHDIVLSALGTGRNLRKTTVISEGCRNIVAGMKKHGIRKLAVVGVRCSIPGQGTPWPLKYVVEDHQRQIDFLEQEKDLIDWIALGPPAIWKWSRVSSSYLVEKNAFTGRSRVTTGEIADFLMKCIKDDSVFNEHNHILVGISSGPAIISTSCLTFLSVSFVAALGLYAAYYYGYIQWN